MVSFEMKNMSPELIPVLIVIIFVATVWPYVGFIWNTHLRENKEHV